MFPSGTKITENFKSQLKKEVNSDYEQMFNGKDDFHVPYFVKIWWVTR